MKILDTSRRVDLIGRSLTHLAILIALGLAMNAMWLELITYLLGAALVAGIAYASEKWADLKGQGK